MVRLAVDPEAKESAHRQNVIVNDVQAVTDREAWDAVAALEHMVLSRGLVSAQQVEAERRTAAVAVLMGEECGVGEECRPYCTGQASHDQDAAEEDEG